jgi:hypothetical protein
MEDLNLRNLRIRPIFGYKVAQNIVSKHLLEALRRLGLANLVAHLEGTKFTYFPKPSVIAEREPCPNTGRCQNLARCCKAWGVQLLLYRPREPD